MFARASPVRFLLYLIQVNSFIINVAGYIIIYPKGIWEEIVIKLNLNDMICRLLPVPW